MSDLRKKFAATKLDELKKTIADEQKIAPSNSGRNDYLEISEGKNRFRLLPKKTEEEKSFRQVKSVHWLDLPTKDDDSTFKRSNILNSKIHGGTKLDIIESYIEFSTKLLKEKAINGEDEDAEEKLEQLVHWKDGLQPKISFVMYAFKINADKSKSFGILEINKTVKDALDKAATAEEDDEAITSDPFTDVDSGRCVVIDYNKNEKGSKKYSVNLANSALRLSDEDLELFDKKPSLSEVYLNVYKLKDFERALKGLQNYDEENSIGTFDEDDWFKIVEKVRGQYKEDTQKEQPKQEVKATKKVETKKVVDEEDEDDEEVETKTFDKKHLEGFTRDQLKEYITENELDVKVKKSMSYDEIVQAILQYEESSNDDSDENAEQPETVEEKAVKSTNNALEALKAKLGRK